MSRLGQCKEEADTDRAMQIYRVKLANGRTDGSRIDKIALCQRHDLKQPSSQGILMRKGEFRHPYACSGQFLTPRWFLCAF